MNNTHKIKTIIFIVAASLALAGTAFANNFTTIEGTIQGANCAILKSPCPLNASDPHVSLENDFVLVAENGEYFFLPNLSKSIKVKYINKDVRITGDKKPHSIVASNLDVKDDGKYKSVWNWEKIVSTLTQGNK